MKCYRTVAQVLMCVTLAGMALSLDLGAQRCSRSLRSLVLYIFRSRKIYSQVYCLQTYLH